ncbi:MAG: anion permease, partial [Firmicutes bacterium HGW-Firmicutes-18]
KTIMLIFIVMVATPIIGLIGAFIITKVVYFFARNAKPGINKLFRMLQIFSSMGFALSYGTNDAPKTMGIIVFSLIVLNLYKPPENSFIIPTWVTVASALSISMGVIFGGKSVIKTVGMSIFRIRQIHGFCTQLSGAVVIYFASIFGMPVSSTHIISGSVMGTGAAERVKAVRWGLSFEMFVVWLVTMPVTAVIAAIIYELLKNGIKLIFL